jgi:DnaJ-class molecular chaperone
MKLFSGIFHATILLCLSDANAFSVPPSMIDRPAKRGTVVGRREAATARAFREEKPKRSFLLEEFTTYNGELVQPYSILGVNREAERVDIRKAYIEMSKQFHPDAVRHRDVLPTGCSSMDDVREQWERMKLSYEILSDRKTRMRYDRHESIATTLDDPSAAMKRAAGKAVSKGAMNLGKGLFDIGAFAFKQMRNTVEN